MPSYVPPPAPAPEGEPGAPPAEHFVRHIPIHIRGILLAPVLVLLACAGGVGAMFLYFTFVYPDPLSMRPRTGGPLIRILALDGSVLDERGAARDYMPLDLLPPHVTDAVIAIEDRRFFEHPGIDPIGVLRALSANARAGRLAQGGSTITQQLAKNLYLTSDRTIHRKLEEVVLALWLELKLSKHDILELYLNRVYFGGGAHGIEAAARRYFAKSARNLTCAEGAVIAGLLKAPSKYAPSASPDQALTRGRIVLAMMRDAGFITEDVEAAAQTEQVRFSGAPRSAESSSIAYAVDQVMEELPPVGVGNGVDIVVDTTLNPALQRRTAEIVATEIERRGDSLAASQGAAVVLAPDGGIRALVGGRSYAESQFNRAVTARRQPGSAFKPFVYLAALETGLAPDTVLMDRPLTVGNWSPRNEGGRYVGPVSMRDALAGSINTVAVRLLLDVGASRVIATARRLGITSELRKDASLALGTSEVSLLELTTAYSAFASGGNAVTPFLIRRIRTSTGRILYARPETSPVPVISPKHLRAMNDMLQATLRSGTGRRAALPNHPAAGKTGTSQEYRDAWFVGYTAHLTAGIWLGNDSGQTMNKVIGGSLPADIWRQVMIAAHQGRPPTALADGSGPPTPPVARDALTGAVAANRRRSYPARRIGEDFVARAIENGTLVARDLETAASGSAYGESRSIIVQPPQ